jgi:hypothetical protein
LSFKKEILPLAKKILKKNKYLHVPEITNPGLKADHIAVVKYSEFKLCDKTYFEP